MVRDMKIEPSIRFDIFIGGDIDQAKQVCREYCFAIGLCVTVEPVSFIYTGGEENGVRIGIINYPRFPSIYEELEKRAVDLAEMLKSRLCQHSYSIVGPVNTLWKSTRGQ